MRKKRSILCRILVSTLSVAMIAAIVPARTYAKEPVQSTAIDLSGHVEVEGKDPVYPQAPEGYKNYEDYKQNTGAVHDTEFYYDQGTKTWYRYITNTNEIRSSKNLVNWTRESTNRNGNAWAPCIIKLREPVQYEGVSYTYALWDSLSTFGTRESWIRLWLSNSPSGGFVRAGDTVISQLDDGKSHNAIDPTVFYDKEGKMWMTFGSFFGGIYLFELDPATCMAKNPGELPGKRIVYRSAYGNSIEGPTIIYNPDTDYYYLNVSYGSLDHTYNVRIGRSRNVEGPYYDYNGLPMDNEGYTNAQADQIGTKITSPYYFEPDNGWYSTGHSSFLYNPDTKEYFLSHNARLETIANNSTRLNVRKLYWTEDGWPVVSPEIYAGEKTEQKIPTRCIPGVYQIVDLLRNDLSINPIESVKRGNKVIELEEDHSISGAYRGSWIQTGDYTLELTLDSVKYTVTLSPAWDWENWTSCLVFTGLSEASSTPEQALSQPRSGVGIWGKKVEARTQLEIDVQKAIPETDKDEYTEKTWNVYEKALDAANKVLANESASEEEIGAARKRFVEAGDALFRKTEGKLVASYDMTVKNGKLADQTGRGNDASYVGFTNADFRTEGTDKILVFDGTNKYVELPAGLIETEKFTIEATFKTNTAGVASWLWCLGAKDNNDYVFVSPDFYGSVVRSGIKLNGTEQLFGNGNAGSIPMDEYTKIRVEYNEGVMKIYVNNNPAVTMNTDSSVQDVLKAGTVGAVCGYIGRSLYAGDVPFTGTLTQFDVYAESAWDPAADKTALENAVDEAKLLESADYTEDSWKALANALAYAESVLADEDAAQETVDEAVDILIKAKQDLKENEQEPPTPPTPPVPDRPFVDVDRETGNWYYDAVYYNYDRDIIKGVNDTHFEPLSDVVRGQFAIMLHRLEGEPNAAYADNFVDVADGAWYTKAIIWTSDAKIVTGYTDGSGRFGPTDPILREQMAVMMYRYAKDFKGYDVSGSSDYSRFIDEAKVSMYAEEAMAWAVGTGIITGKDLDQDGKSESIDPQGVASRAECAIIFQRFLQKYEK